ncbi:hypothetical protein [Chitinophaga rhizophila]|uniref:Uncharacterized protein n=1 Tax=Chitinophaga rhizophila TaxID=2866212 RepID=A0ABS7GID3_9BACT|nr:hypothetical protein [Chitinophaga rhizophila]MBW8687439.1 hypothetical protein [Chitinophaga rhizophila]
MAENFCLLEAIYPGITAHRGAMIAGTPGRVKQRMLKLAGNYDVNEIVAATMTAHAEDSFRFYEPLAEMFERTPRNIS